MVGVEAWGEVGVAVAVGVEVEVWMEVEAQGGGRDFKTRSRLARHTINSLHTRIGLHLSNMSIPWLLYKRAKKRHEFTPSAAASPAAIVVKDAIGCEGRRLSLKIWRVRTHRNMAAGAPDPPPRQKNIQSQPTKSEVCVKR